MQTKAEQQARITEAAERIHTVRPIALEALPVEPRQEALEAKLARHSSAIVAEAFAATLADADGYEVSGEGISVVVFPETLRAGVTWGGNTEWTDVDAAGGEAAAREAVARYLAGEMVP